MTKPADRAQDGAWTFEGFGEGFDSHVAAHLPGYLDAQNVVALSAQFYLPEGGVLADFGASTGRSVEIITERVNRPFSAYLYDSDRSMLDVAAERCPGAATFQRTFPDDQPLMHPPADVTLSMWFLQFVPPQSHRAVLEQMRSGAAPGSALLIATKTRHPDSRWEEIAVAALDDYKDTQGVSAEDRAAKTRSLRGRMYPVEWSALFHNIRDAGWKSPELLWRWHVWSVVGAFA